MSEVELYDNLAESYDLLISWKTRLRRERPFFSKIFKEYRVRRILDTACGTGMHAAAFHDWGYHVVGTDLSAPMIEKARENVGGRDIGFIQAGFEELSKIEGLFDAVTCVGNSLPHVLTDDGLDASLANMRDVLLPGGILVIHGNNYDRITSLQERFMPVAQVRRNGHDYMFLRFFDFHGERLTFNVVSMRKEGGVWKMFPDSSTHRALTRSLLVEHLERTGFVEIRCFGAFTGEPFDEIQSDNLIVVAQKPHTAVSKPVSEPVKAIDRIPIRENNEPLVDLEQFAPEIARAEKKIVMRKKVAEMLQEAQQLLSDGMRLKVQIAFRSLAYQRELYAAYHDQLVEAHPNWPESQVRRELNKLVAPPDSGHPPGHTTGGAVDLTVVDADGEELDMMSPLDPNADESRLYPTYSRFITPAAAKNRQILIEVMTKVGFSNYAGEWWHYAYGENGWALRLGHPFAVYGAAPEEQAEGIEFDKSLSMWEA